MIIKSVRTLTLSRATPAQLGLTNLWLNETRAYLKSCIAESNQVTSYTVLSGQSTINGQLSTSLKAASKIKVKKAPPPPPPPPKRIIAI